MTPLPVAEVMLAKLAGEKVWRHHCPICGRDFWIAKKSWWSYDSDIPCPPCWVTHDFANGHSDSGEFTPRRKPLNGMLPDWNKTFCYVPEESADD